MTKMASKARKGRAAAKAAAEGGPGAAVEAEAAAVEAEATVEAGGATGCAAGEAPGEGALPGPAGGAGGLPPDGAEIEIPLGRLKRSPRNARRTPHSAAHIEALAGSIAAKRMLQKPVVEPERDEAGRLTGDWLVTIGEGRRLALALRVSRGEIDHDYLVACTVDLTHDPEEISLDENVTRENLHPADEFEAFLDQTVRLGRSAEEVAARFGVTPLVVRRRLKLARVSPRLIQAYRDGDLDLDDLMAFAVSDDHARQEQVYETLPPYKIDPNAIRRAMTERKVAATDRRALFVGVEAYEAAGGRLLRDLFQEDRGGWFEDATLLDRLCLEKLQAEADRVREAEGWKWAEAFVDYPHHLALHRVYPERIGRSEEEDAKVAALHAELESLTEQWADAEEPPPEVEARVSEIEAELEAFPEPYAYRPEAVARGGLFVVLNYDGEPRIERGFIRAEDMATEADDDQDHQHHEGDGDDGDHGDGERRAGDDDGHGDRHADEAGREAEAEEEPDKPLSAALVAELSAYRTAGLRDALAEDPDAALVVTVHALALQVFYSYAQLTCADLRLTSVRLEGPAPEIGACPAGKRIADRHDAWAANLPPNPAELWDYVVGLDHDSRMALLAHCVSLSLNGLRGWERRLGAWAHADALATHLSLDMTRTWVATAESYFGRVTKARIAEAVTEGVDAAAALRIAELKKPEMAAAAEQLLEGRGWLPVLLRTPKPSGEAAGDRADGESADHELMAAE